MSDPVYCYPPDHTVLRNRLNIRTQDELDAFERKAVQVRAEQGPPTGRFDLAHLQAIHGHLFQDVYEWAGELRTVEISKGSSQFQPRQFIQTGIADVHRRLEEQNFLRDRAADGFAQGAGPILGDVNYVHPFREGNGRTQLIYLQQLGRQAGHDIDLTRIERGAWMWASIRAHQGEYKPLSNCVRGAIDQTKDRDSFEERVQKSEADLDRKSQSTDMDDGYDR